MKPNLLALLLLTSATLWSQNYYVTTVAGDGHGNYSFDLYPAKIAELDNPLGPTVDSGGNLYFADYYNNRVRKIALDQTITTIAGNGNGGYSGDGGPAIGTQLNRPTSVAIDAVGNLYIADQNNQRVRMVSPNGIITTVAGTGQQGYSGDRDSATSAKLSNPAFVAVDAAGNLYIADSGNNRIRRVGGDGNITTVAGGAPCCTLGDGGPAISAYMNNPAGIAFDSAGNMYVAETGSSLVRKVTLDGKIATVAGGKSSLGDNGPATSGGLYNPVGLAVDAAGNIYIADNDNQRVRKVSGGIIATIAGAGNDGYSGDGGPATQAMFSYPQGVAVDPSGRIYIADTGNNVIRILTLIAPLTISNARLRTATTGQPYSGGAVATGGNLPYTWSVISGSLPPGLTLAPSTGLITGTPTTFSDTTFTMQVADSGSPRQTASQLFTISSAQNYTITTVAGTGVSGFSGDHSQATSAQLNGPTGLTVDSAGNVYFADTNNHRVRKIALDHTITTVAGNGNASYGGDGGPATSAQLYYPTGTAVDAAGNLYIADNGNSRVRKVSPGGTITTIAGTGGFGYSGDGGPATAAQLRSPSDIALDSASNLYIADAGNGLIRRVGPDGKITTVVGGGSCCGEGDGNLAISAELNSPTDVVFDSLGNLYIVDSSQNRIAEVLASGFIRTLAGGTVGYSGDGGASYLAQLDGPVGLSMDASGAIYVADRFNNRVRKITPDFTITTIAGSGSSGFTGENVPALSVALYGPQSVAVDGSGHVYIADTNNSRIRVLTPVGCNGSCTVAPSPGPYQITPASLTFQGTAGGNLPGGQSITLSSTATGLAFTASVDSPWLTVTPSSGTIPATLQINANPSALTAGTYQGTIAVSVPNGAPATATVGVAFTVQPATTPAATLSVDTKNVSFSASQGGGTISQLVQVLNTSGGSVVVTASAATSSGGSWLSVSAPSGPSTTSSPAYLTVTAIPGTLTPGTYSGTITITGGGKTIAVPATLSISAPGSATILLSQSALSFTVVSQGGVPLGQNFGILNIGQGSMNWTATGSTTSSGNWLQFTPSSGTVTRPYLDVSLVNVSIDPTLLGPGMYYGAIQVSAAAANSPQLITVMVTVLPAGFTLGPQVFPAGLIFTGVAGVSPPSQSVQLGNPAGTPNSFMSGITGTGFSYTPTAASVAPKEPTIVQVNPDFSKLVPGSVQTGAITLLFSDRSLPQNITVLMVVAPSGTTPNSRAGAGEEGNLATAQPEASGCATQSPFIVFRTPQPSQPTFGAVVGQGSTLDVQVTDPCGNLIGPGGQNASVKATFSNNDSVQMTHIGNGIWQGTWRPLSAGTVSMLVTAFEVVQNGGVVGGQSATLTAIVSAPTGASASPAVTAQGVVHAASGVGGVPIAPGGLITIYGQNLADGSGPSSGLPLPDQLNGTQVLLGNQPIPILYTSPGQLNVQVPYGVPVNTQYQLTVQRESTYSVPQQLVVAQAQPGIFTLNQQGSGQGSIVRSDGITLAQPATPASIGEAIVIYCAGLGAVTPNVKEGTPPLASPLSTTVNPVTVTIGGKPAVVYFAGLTPGDPGLYQINAVVPSGIVTGDAVPVVISVAGQTSPISPAVTMAVR